MNAANIETKIVNKTSLYDFHKSFGAKLVNFAGYEMPIQYQDGIIQEHLHTRNAIGIFDVSHMGQLKIADPQNQSFIATYFGKSWLY